MKLGEWQKLQVVRVLPIGAYLADPQEMAAAGEDGKREEVLLPANQLTDPVVPGEQIDVFLYRDSEDRLIATRQEPAITLGGIARLTVRETGKIGAFLDWGLVKDLLLPFAEQKRRVQPGDRVMVMLYIDNSDRLAATMRIEEHLTTDSPYHAGDMVTGTIYQIHPVIGAFTAVENRYHGLIPKKEFAGALREGDVLTLRVTHVKPDGKLDLALREAAPIQMDRDASLILEKLVAAGGFLPYHDKSDPEDIRRMFDLSKAAFKRAIGRLYREQKIQIEEDGISLTDLPKQP